MSTYKIQQHGDRYHVICDGRKISECKTREKAEQVITLREQQIADNDLRSATEVEHSRRMERLDAEIVRRLATGDTPIKHVYGGTLTGDTSGDPNTEHGHAIFSDGWECGYTTDPGDGRDGYHYSAESWMDLPTGDQA